MSDKKLMEKIERSHSKKQRELYKKISKPVEWNGQIFESRVALARHLKLDHSSMVSVYIGLKRKLKGFVPKSIEKVLK